MMDDCGIFFREGVIYIITTSYSIETCLGKSIGPMFKVGLESKFEIGKNVIAALDATRFDLPESVHHDPSIEKNMYQFLGVKSWAEIEKTFVYTAVSREGSETNILLYRPSKYGGFEEYGNPIVCKSTDAEEIGRAVIKALKVKE